MTHKLGCGGGCCDSGKECPMTAPQQPTPHVSQPPWIYKRESAGMGEWCYRIYRNNHYMVYAESESIAMIICNGLNRDEQPHTSAQPEQQRIDAVIKELEKRAQRHEDDGHTAYSEGMRGAIALLQAGRT